MKHLHFLVLTILISSIGYADVKFEKNDGKVEFKAKGWPSLLKINGKGEGFSGTLKEKGTGASKRKLSGELFFELKTLKTGIDLRDKHLKEKYLKVSEHPKAVLYVKDLILPAKGKFKFKANLKLKNVVRPVMIVAKLVPKKTHSNLTAQFKIKLSDFKVEIPSFKGVTVAEEVEVKVSAKTVGSKAF